MLTKSSAQSVDYSTETSSPGHLVPFSGVANSPHGDALVAGLLLILLFAAALLIPFERLMPQERSGSKSLPSTNIDSLPRKKSGGTAKEQYDKK